jgi:hypothetical protein
MPRERKVWSEQLTARPRAAGSGLPALKQPVSFWLASLASLAVIVGGVGPWATYLNYVSISGTSMHGWREVAVGGLVLVLLATYQVRGWRLPALAAALLGVLGVLGAIEDLHAITSGGTVTVFGVSYRLLSPAWGIYLVLVGTATIAVSAFALLWGGFRGRSAWLRRTRGVGVRQS